MFDLNDFKILSIEHKDLEKIIVKIIDANFFKHQLIFQWIDYIVYKACLTEVNLSVRKDDVFLNKILLSEYGRIPVEHTYEIYDFTDKNNKVFLSIVSRSLYLLKD